MKDDRRLGLAVGLDVFVVVLFVAIGRRNHQDDSAFVGIVETALPFLVGLAAGWLLARGWNRPLAMLTGLVVWPTTLLVGMIVRNLVFDRGTATSFVIVATLFLGAGLVGWRIVANRVLRRRNVTGQLVR
jgi:hypothetical protein